MFGVLKEPTYISQIVLITHSYLKALCMTVYMFSLHACNIAEDNYNQIKDNSNDKDF